MPTTLTRRIPAPAPVWSTSALPVPACRDDFVDQTRDEVAAEEADGERVSDFRGSVTVGVLEITLDIEVDLSHLI